MGVLHDLFFSNRDNLVGQYSENYKKLLEINSKYNFVSIPNHINIEENEFSLKSFNDILAKQIILYKIENNDNYIRNWIESALYNQSIYYAYDNEVNSLNYETPIESINKTNLNPDKFYKVEKDLINKYRYHDSIFNIKAHVYVYRVNRNYDIKQRKDREVYFNELVSIYNEWSNGKRFSETTRKERKLMNSTLRRQVLSRDGYRCCVCGKTVNDGIRLEIDHIIPVSKGGQTTISNLQTLCNICNAKKCAQDNQSFVASETKNQLKKKLLAFRKERSRQLNMPAYYIFNNDELDKLLKVCPKTLEELKESNILPNIKVKTHGREIVKVINED